MKPSKTIGDTQKNDTFCLVHGAYSGNGSKIDPSIHRQKWMVTMPPNIPQAASTCQQGDFCRSQRGASWTLWIWQERRWQPIGMVDICQSNVGKPWGTTYMD